MLNLISQKVYCNTHFGEKLYVKMQTGSQAVTSQIPGSRTGRHERWRETWRQPQSRNVIK